MLYRLMVTLIAACLLTGAAAAEEMPPIPKFREVAVHDPSIIRAEDGSLLNNITKDSEQFLGSM